MNSAGAPSKRKVLLIGWDAADWEHINPLLEEGLLPTLDGLINRGVIGNLATLQPILSPMLWNSVATGKLADKHGIHGFIEPDPESGGARPYSSTSRKCKALWNILTQSGLRSNVVGWWASHPAEPIDGTVVTNAFGGVKFDPARGWIVPPGTVHPPEKASALAPFRVFPTELTQEHLLPFIPQAATINQKEDPRLQTCAKIISDAASIHAVATALMETEPWDFMAVYYDAIDHFSHAFMPYHPPKLPWIKEEDFQLYKDVVRGAYRFHDMLLERLLQLAGPETTVILCSDHGFESGPQRPQGIPREPAGPAIWHRQYGILVMQGAGIKKDERIYGASLIDITPTVLTLFGLPVGEDMDGRPLVEAFENEPQITTIPSWETRPGASGQHSGEVRLDRNQAQELMQQFAALGYIEDPHADKAKQSESAEVEAKYNLARTLAWKNRSDQALPLLQEIFERRPWEERFIMQLAGCYFQAGYLRQAERLLSLAYEGSHPGNAMGTLLWAKIKLGLSQHEEGLQALLVAEKMNPRFPGVHTQLGDAFARLFQFEKAQLAYAQAIELDSDNALALQGLSSVYRRQGLNQETVDTALRAVGLLHRLPVAHFNLGVALARCGERERATIAFETALRFAPNMVNAHRFLAHIYRGEGGSIEKARYHRQAAEQALRKVPRIKQDWSARAEKLFDLPVIPGVQERGEILLRERPDPKEKEERSGKEFILVSGLPRSGTSLMMQLLEAGGMSLLTDGERTPDVDNPRGYYEWEPIKQIQRRPELLDEAGLEGRVIKCISMLLSKMPAKHDYKVIFMTRPIEEVVRSQRQMVERLGTQAAQLDVEQLERGLTVHRNETRSWLSGAPHVSFIEMDYTELIRDPAPSLAQLVQFLGEARLPRRDEMAAVIDRTLYRMRS